MKSSNTVSNLLNMILETKWIMQGSIYTLIIISISQLKKLIKKLNRHFLVFNFFSNRSS